jgi:hypothetical protein
MSWLRLALRELKSCTAKMGQDSMSVVDGNLKVHGIDNLRVADGSIMPRVTPGNTMAPCVVIRERADVAKCAWRVDALVQILKNHLKPNPSAKNLVRSKALAVAQPSNS